MCNVGVYSTHVLHVYNVYYTLFATYVIHLYFYTYNIPKTPHMYYRCSTTGHVENERGQTREIRGIDSEIRRQVVRCKIQNTNMFI